MCFRVTYLSVCAPVFPVPPSLHRFKLEREVWVSLKYPREDFNPEWAPPGYFGPLKVKVSKSSVFFFFSTGSSL